MTLNHDLESQLNINEGENLIAAIDRNYREIALRPSGQSLASIAATADDPYAREMNKQAKYGDDNRRLAKDLRAFNTKLGRAAKGAGNAKQLAWKAQRPSTAKTQYSGQQKQVSQLQRNNVPEIEETTLDREMDSAGIGKDNVETTFRNSGGPESEAQRLSRSRSRSLRKQLREKDGQPSKVRPRSAYTQPQRLYLAPGGAAELNRNLKSITNPTGLVARNQFE